MNPAIIPLEGEAIERAVAALRDHLSRAEFSGTVRVSTGGSVLLEHAGGFANRADRVPNEIDTRFGTASLTKSFTAASICRLVDQGLASFDARAIDVLPAGKRPSTLSDRVTLHHLLTHTSGIADYYDEVALGPAAFELVWAEHPSYLFREPSDFLPLFEDIPSICEPGGTEGHYCNAGFILLGLVIEELSGRSYIDYVEQEIFRTAGMNDSGFFAMDDVRERVATGYVARNRGEWKTNHYAIPTVGGPDGGAFSTVRDLETFLDALSGEVLFGEGTWNLMRTPHANIEGTSYGYGLWMNQTRRGLTYGGAGADPGFSARAFHYPEIDLTVVMLGNTIYETDEPVRIFRTELGE